MSIDPDLQDDLYYELSEDLTGYLNHYRGGDLDEVMELVEVHADRRTAKSIRIIANTIAAMREHGLPGTEDPVKFLHDCADRVDPDVDTKGESE